MAETHDPEHPVQPTTLTPETDHPVEDLEKSTPSARGSRRTLGWLAALLLLVIAGVGLSPFWARDVARLLPWGRQFPTAPAEDYSALAARLAVLEKRPATQPTDTGAINSVVSTLSRRVDQLETARGADKQTYAEVEATKAGLQQLEERLKTLETRSASRANSQTAELEKLRQEVAQIGNVSTDLAERITAVERKIGATSGALRTNGALLAAVLQMRQAIEAARPFAAECDAFIALAQDQPDLIAAAQPLAKLAQTGVASNAALSERLGRLSGRIAPAVSPPTGTDLRTQALDWLHSLVTIRRIDTAPQAAQEPAMSVAEAALARGDLRGAVSALQTLSGSGSEAIQSWLQMAQQRLTAEAAVAHLQELLLARLGPPPEVPASAPTKAPAKSGQPS